MEFRNNEYTGKNKCAKIMSVISARYIGIHQQLCELMYLKVIDLLKFQNISYINFFQWDTSMTVSIIGAGFNFAIAKLVGPRSGH